MLNEHLKKYSKFSRKKSMRNKKDFEIWRLLSQKKIKKYAIISFTRQLATLTVAGIPIIQSLDITLRNCDTVSMTNLITTIKTDIQSGLKISDALANHPKYFDHLYCALIEAGEESGSLGIILERLANYMEKIASIKQKIRKAFFYPAAVIMIGLVVSSILLLKVIPEFKTLFTSVGAELPKFTQFVLNISNWAQHNTLTTLVGVAILTTGYCVLHKQSLSFRIFVDRIKLRIPILGVIYIKTILARFSKTLATMFSSGMPLVESLRIVAKSSDNLIYQKGIENARIEITEGKSLYHALETTDLFPRIMLQMIAIGEETGELEKMLVNTARVYEEEVDNAIASLSTLIEPIIMAILGVLIGGLVIAMYLPIFQLSDVISK